MITVTDSAIFTSFGLSSPWAFMLCDVDVGVVWMLSSLTKNDVSHEYTCIGRHNSEKVDVL